MRGIDLFSSREIDDLFHYYIDITNTQTISTPVLNHIGPISTSSSS